MSKSDQEKKNSSILNSYDILDEFNCRDQSYHSPLPRKKQRVSSRSQRPGKVKIYTEEEKLLYQMQKYKEELKRRNGNDQ